MMEKENTRFFIDFNIFLEKNYVKKKSIYIHKPERRR